MKKIDISTPKYPRTFALVDDSDFSFLNADKWHADEQTNGKIYARRTVRTNGKRSVLRMHTAIMGRVDGKEIDHRDGNGLNNQRHNLRHSTKAENQMNRCIPRNNTSGYKGVSWCKRENKWLVQIKYEGKRKHLGYFSCLVKAAKYYDLAAIQYFGEFARLNFPEL